MNEPTTAVSVTIAIKIGDETKLFAADAATGGDAHDLAYGVLGGVKEEAGRWLHKTGSTARRGH